MRIERTRSVSSIRRIHFPPCFRAKRWLNSAVRSPPRCNAPVGEGANRRMGVTGFGRGMSETYVYWEISTLCNVNSLFCSPGRSPPPPDYGSTLSTATCFCPLQHCRTLISKMHLASVWYMFAGQNKALGGDVSQREIVYDLLKTAEDTTKIKVPHVQADMWKVRSATVIQGHPLNSDICR